MIIATQDGQPTRATPGERATCPECGQSVIAKCGEIVIWHWAHLQASPSCRYHEETEWHLRWKEWALEQGCRVEVPTKDRRHRADIVAPNGVVLELQSTSLPPEEIRARERAYHRYLHWIFRITEEQQERLHWGKEIGGGRGFWFKRGPKRLTIPTRPMYLDMDDGYSNEILKITANLKTKHSDEWGTTYQRVLGIAWSADRRDLIGTGEMNPNLRALMARLRQARDNQEEWYMWILERAQTRGITPPNEPVRTSRDNMGQERLDGVL